MLNNKLIRVFSGYLKERYGDADKIVEVGIGKRKGVYYELKNKLGSEVISTDVAGEEEDYTDDIFSPTLGIYRGSDLIYSIHPPIDLQKPMASVCKKIECDLIIIPFKDEILDLSHFFEEFKLKNIENLVFYQGEI